MKSLRRIVTISAIAAGAAGLALLALVVALVLLPHPDTIFNPRIVYPDDHDLSVMIDQFDGDGLRAVTLNEYDHSSSNRYLTTGESITFRFPSDAFLWSMQDGTGAQRAVYLYLDSKDLQPMGPRLKAIRTTSMTDAERLELEAVRRRGISVVVNLSSSSGLVLADIANGNLITAGEQCDLVRYMDAREQQRTKVLEEIRAKRYPVQAPYDLRPDTFVSRERVADNFRDDSFLFLAECTVDVPSHCTARAYFEGWPIYFGISQDRVCTWRDELKRIQDYLAAHVVARTPQQYPFKVPRQN